MIVALDAAEVALTATQVRVTRELFGSSRARPRFGSEVSTRLRRFLARGIAPLEAALAPNQRIILTKGVLGQLHTCEGWWLGVQQAPFVWSAAVTQGVVAHKAVELSITLANPPPPLDLVDLALDHIIASGGDWGPRDWLLTAPPADVAAVRGAAADWLTKFDDSFPPLRRAWRPRVESSLRVCLGGGRIVLKGKVDLALGRPMGTKAGVLIVDFKTGPARRVHVDDLRFYALLETLRVGVPPFRVATFSLDSGTWQAEDVDGDVLMAAARRVLAGAAKLVELTGPSRAPVLTPGPACGWCPARHRCPAARLDIPIGVAEDNVAGDDDRPVHSPVEPLVATG